MDLRPELMPPPIDEAQADLLIALADRLCAAAFAGRAYEAAEDDLARFNATAGTVFTMATFLVLPGSEDADTFVRKALCGARIRPARDVTRDELVEVCRRAMPQSGFFDDHAVYMAILDANLPTRASMRIFEPPPGYAGSIGDYDPSPEEIVDWALSSAGKPVAR